MKPSSQSTLMVIIAWGAVPLMVFTFWYLDLFAKSYDLRGVHVAGLFALCALTVVTGALLGLAIRFVFKDPFRHILKLLLWLPPLLGFLFVLWDVNWRPVYIASLSLPICAIVFSPRRFPARMLAILFAFGTLALLIVSEIPTLRFQRYANQFKTGCWCCGYRQRAMRELCSFQEQGYDVIAKMIAGDEGQIYNTSKEIYSDKGYTSLRLWFSEKHPTVLKQLNQ